MEGGERDHIETLGGRKGDTREESSSMPKMKNQAAGEREREKWDKASHHASEIRKYPFSNEGESVDKLLRAHDLSPLKKSGFLHAQSKI